MSSDPLLSGCDLEIGGIGSQPQMLMIVFVLKDRFISGNPQLTVAALRVTIVGLDQMSFGVCQVAFVVGG